MRSSRFGLVPKCRNSERASMPDTGTLGRFSGAGSEIPKDGLDMKTAALRIDALLEARLRLEACGTSRDVGERVLHHSLSGLGKLLKRRFRGKMNWVEKR
jgi:hypothetical protein